jgi:hypothetical protein
VVCIDQYVGARAWNTIPHHRQKRHLPVTESVVLPPDGDRIMSKRKTTEQKWHEQSEATKDEAAKLPYGRLKEQLLRKASQLQTASQISRWLSSPGLQPPT